MPQVLKKQVMKKEDVLERLKECLGEKALRALRDQKAQLHIWRRSSPHNWFVLRISRYETLWHSHDGSLGPRVLPSLEAFELVKHSSQRIMFGSETGSCEESIYRLKRRFRNAKHRP